MDWPSFTDGFPLYPHSADLILHTPRPHSMGWKDHNEVSGAGGRESRAKWNEKWFVHYEEAREHGAASLSVFPATLMEAEK